MIMDKLFDILSTRELALLTWLSFGLIAMMFSKSIRNGLREVVKLLFGKKIGTVLLMLTTYVSILLLLLHKFDLWNLSHLKDTIFWFCATALVLFFNINKAKTKSYFKNIIKENLKWAIAIEFIVNFYTFSFGKEMVLVPTMIFLAILQGVAQADKKFIQVSKFLESVFAFIGVALLAFVLYKTLNNYQEIFSVHQLFVFLLPPLLTVFLIPFLYLLAIFMNYEELFVRLNIMTHDNKKKKLLKREIILSAHFSINRLSAISKNLKKFDWFQADNIKSYVKTLTR